MKRNSKYIMNKIRDKYQLAKPAQIGVDLTLQSVERQSEYKHTIYNVFDDNSKMSLGKREKVDIETRYGFTGWVLEPGTYFITFDQGIDKLSSTENATIIQRSSMNRAGTQVVGSVYDPGFETDNLGATMIVHLPIMIPVHTRVAQILIDENEEVNEKDLYDGTWQGKANH